MRRAGMSSSLMRHKGLLLVGGARARKALVALTIMVAVLFSKATQPPRVGTCGPPPASQARFGITCAWEEAVSDSVVPPQCCCVQLPAAALAAPWQEPRREVAGPGGAAGSSSGGTASGAAPATGTRCFPHAIVVGAQKGGTTATFAHFLMRSDFEAPRAKEVHFFDHLQTETTEGGDEVVITDLDPNPYLLMMPEHARGKFTIEASPSYMIRRSNVEAIATMLPHVQLIVCLRDPVTRLKSEVHMASNMVHPVEMRKEHFARSLASILLHGSRILPQCTMQHNETRDVVLADGREVTGSLLRPGYRCNDRHLTDYVHRGLYHRQLLDIYSLFPESQVHIMWDKDLMDRPKDTLQGLFDFLKLPMTHLPSWDKQAVDEAVANALRTGGSSSGGVRLPGSEWSLHSQLTPPSPSGTPSPAPSPADVELEPVHHHHSGDGNDQHVTVRPLEEILAMWEELTTAMKAAYRPYNQQLYRLLGREFPWD